MLRVWDVKTVIHISKFYGRSLTYLLVFNCVGGLFKTNITYESGGAAQRDGGQFGLQPLYHFQGRL